MKRLAPATVEEACEIVREARGDNRTFRIEGGGTRAGLGRPVDGDAILSTQQLSGIVLYEPAEMVLRARAGTPLKQVRAALEANGQMLPFEPMDHRALYTTQGEPTIGALAACNIAGPRRIRAAAARDALIGVRFVNGAGQDVSSGGRVMKNVTGLDIVKLQCGAFGTLGLLTEVTFKLLPKPETSASLVFQGLDVARAVAAMSAALKSPFEVSAAAHDPDGPSRTVLRIEHFSPSVVYRCDALAAQLADFGKPITWDAAQSQAFWRGMRDAEFLAAPHDAQIWRISIRPSKAIACLEAIRAAGLDFRYLLDHGGGLLWLSCAGDNSEAAVRTIRKALPDGAHAMLVRADERTRRTAPVFQPLSDGVLRLSAGVKAAIDPAGLFNPGCMYAGI